MHLCDVCLAMRPILHRVSSIDYKLLERYQVHYDGFASLFRASRAGCYICRRLWRNYHTNVRSTRRMEVHPATFYIAETAAQGGEDPRHTARLKIYRKGQEYDKEPVVLLDVFYYIPYAPSTLPVDICDHAVC